MDRKLRRAHVPVASIAFDPGFTPETGLTRAVPAYQVWLSRSAPMKWLLKRVGVTMGSLSFSGAALARVVAGTEPMFADDSGKYFQSNDGTLIVARSSKASYDEAKATKLWEESAQLVRLQTNEQLAHLR